MGWVDDRFKREAATSRKIGPLWDSIRDSIGRAVMEYNRHVSGTDCTVYRADCTAKANMCMRLEMRGTKPRSVEVFIDDNEPSLNVYDGVTKESKEICRYRLNDDLTAIELYSENPDSISTILTVDSACEKALSNFLFRPFPLYR